MLLNKGLVLGILAVLAIISVATYYFYHSEKKKEIRKTSQNIEKNVKSLARDLTHRNSSKGFDIKNNVAITQNIDKDIELVQEVQNFPDKDNSEYADDSRSREDFELID